MRQSLTILAIKPLKLVHVDLSGKMKQTVGAETNSMPSTSAARNASNTGKKPNTSGEPKGPPPIYLVSMKYWL